MKVDSIPLSVAFNVASGLALAQGASDPMEHLRACSLMEHAERLECLDKLSRNIAPPARPAPDGDNLSACGFRFIPAGYSDLKPAIVPI